MQGEDKQWMQALCTKACDLWILGHAGSEKTGVQEDFVHYSGMTNLISAYSPIMLKIGVTGKKGAKAENGNKKASSPEGYKSLKDKAFCLVGVLVRDFLKCSRARDMKSKFFESPPFSLTPPSRVGKTFR